MDTLFLAFLWTHIAAGTMALLAGPIAMVARKGGQNHRRGGRLFFWAMMWIAISAVALSLMRSGTFLLLVGVFSFYLTFTGYRIIYRKTPAQRAGAIDWIAAILALAGSLGLVVWAQTQAARGIALVSLTFAGIGAIFAITDMARFIRPPSDPNAWWFVHMTRMLASYIATVTAF
ncbi:MAG: DUF2306 domain-containing protein, partial [Verrucomicrobiaceae bacterium]